MPNPSVLHDPLAKLYFPLAPILPQLMAAAERDLKDGEGWGPLLDAAVREIKRLREDNGRLSRALSGGEGVWLWRGDGNDHPESLTCQVLMTASQVRDILEKA